MIVRSLEDLKAEDELIYLLHDPRPQLLKRLSGGMQAPRLLLETLPEVEKLPRSPQAIAPAALPELPENS